MLVKMPYGKDLLALELREEEAAAAIILEAKPLPGGDEKKLIDAALKAPIGSAPLSGLVKGGEKAVIIVGDMTRAWVRHDRFIPALISELNAGGINDQQITIVSATGDHRPQSEKEHRVLVGNAAYKRIRVLDHSSTDQANLVYLETTTRGTPVWVNRLVVEADRVIITGGIVYHFLAGWGGGNKALIPGVSGRKTIMANHGLAFLPGEGTGLNPLVCAGISNGNPLYEDILEAAALVNPDFMLNTVINEEKGTIAKVFAGHHVEAHQAGCRFVDDSFKVPVNKEQEVIIASCGGFPKDINFYQSYKTIYNASRILEKGGTLLLISECREGIGNESFFEMFTAYKNNPARESALRRDYSIGGQMAYHSALIAEENDLLVLSEIADETVETMGMIPLRSLDQGLAWIRDKYGKIPPCCLMPHGGTTFPALS